MEAAVIGMIPEGLYLLTSVALAVSTLRLAKKQVLLHNMKSIETLARVNVLCVDKTGTITENKMAVQKLVEVSEYSEKNYFTEHSERKAVSMTSFSSVTKYSSVTFEDGAYVLGAPEIVLRKNYDKYAGEIETHTKKGSCCFRFV